MSKLESLPRKILLYVPNLICYGRFAMILCTVSLLSHLPGVCVVIFLIFTFCDGIDGWAARKLDQCSAFGAWLDVIVDNFGRTIIWSNFQWGFLVSNIEWITFICNQKHGSQWKEGVKSASHVSAPIYVTKVMEKGFKTPIGFFAICGLHGLPIWWYAWNHNIFEDVFYFLPSTAPMIGFILLALGRALCAAVEVWCISTHVKLLLSCDN